MCGLKYEPQSNFYMVLLLHKAKSFRSDTVWHKRNSGSLPEKLTHLFFAKWSSMAAVRAVRAVAALLSADDLQEPGKLGVMTWVFRRKMRPKGCPENHLRYSGAVERIRCGAFRDFVNASCFG